MLLKTVLLLIALLTLLTLLRAVKATEGETYEPVEGMCDKCNCTSADGTLQDGEKGKLFSYDCSRRSFSHLFSAWPEEIADNDTDTEIIFIMSLNDLEKLQQLPATNARIFFTCRHCKISEIESRAFIDTLNIISLDLSYNRIESSDLFPDVFRGIENDDEYAPIKLETLDLSYNNIKYLEELIFEHTPHIKSLDLSHNPISAFDEPTEAAFKYLHNLEILDLSFTMIMELPEAALEKTKKLRELFLSGNRFLTVPESLYMVGESLEYLQLSDNPIELIGEKSFDKLSKLHQLNISAMEHLEAIEKNSFAELDSLEVLLCRGNRKLSNFHMGNLLDLKHLKELDVTSNNLTTLNFGVVKTENATEKFQDFEKEEIKKHEDRFKKLRVLKLAGNPWKCDCPMMKSLSLFDHNAKYFIKSANNDEARCKTPYDISSKLLYDLPAEFVCSTHLKQKDARIPLYDTPQFLRPKSIMLTVFSVVGFVVVGVIIGIAIVCIKRRLKPSSEPGYSTSPIRYTTVRDSTISNIANSPYSP